nr:hypothetical protein [Pseudomonas sp. LPH1]
MNKKTYKVDLRKDAQSSLQSQIILSQTTFTQLHHLEQNFRLPLGMYNISVTRLCKKIMNLCKRLEEYLTTPLSASPPNDHSDLMDELIDYIELSLYASAEHADDIYAIASGFFKSKQLRDKDQHYRRLDKALKEHKRFLSAAANNLKHQQARIRIFSVEYVQGLHSGCLHGYFIEGVSKGTIGPSKIFHSQEDTFSITTLVWEQVLLLLNCSYDLAEFLASRSQTASNDAEVKNDIFSKTIIAATRLPTYTFGERHPFSRVSVSLNTDEDSKSKLNSGLYGSLLNPWSKSDGLSIGRAASRFEGDGVSKNFQFAQPKQISLLHWS